MATIYDVARAAGVSTSTVSHVLNGTRHVNETTKSRVQEAMVALGYHPSALARGLVRQETQTLALVVPDNVNPFFAELAQGIENYAFSAGYTTILCNSDRDTAKEAAYLDMLISRRVDGIIYMTMSATAEPLEPLLRRKIPLVALEREYAGVDAILVDNEEGAHKVTSHLIALGHRRIACIGGREALAREHPRIHGYELALREAGLPLDPALIVSGDWTYTSGLRCAGELLKLPDPPTAIFACNDMMAIGAMRAVHEAGMSVPVNVSVAGFDNVGLSSFAWPPLTTLATPIVEVGRQLCQMLLKRIKGDLPNEPQRLTVRGELVVRGSTSPALSPGD